MQTQYYPKHYCGVFGIFGHPKAAELTYYGLYALQHRGQESAGMGTCHNGKIYKHLGMGLVPQVFSDPKILAGLIGDVAIGHTRYSTTGGSRLGNAQPLFVRCKHGEIGIAHNGNLTNTEALRQELYEQGVALQSTTDSEIMLMLIARFARSGVTIVQAIHKMMKKVVGSYSLVILMEDGSLIAVRDPHGFRPLVLGTLDGSTVIASETCAFDLIKARFERKVNPGEVVVVNRNGMVSYQFPTEDKPMPERAFCAFEGVYFAKPDSMYDDTRTIYDVRKEMGHQLAREHPVEADLVIPIPDSGVCAALGYAEESGIHYEMAFVRNHFVGRSFLQPTQFNREFYARVKINLIGNLVKNKRVVIVDDSIVRGTTCRSRVKTLKEAGAREVHVAVSCPPHMFPCFYGIDFPDRSKLMAATNTLPEIQRILGADSLGFLSLEGMKRILGPGLCLACWDGNYPTAIN